MARGLLPSSKVGNLVRFDVESCDRALERFRVPGQIGLGMDSGDPIRNWKSKRQIAVHLQVSLRTVSNLMRRRLLPFVQIGSVIRFDLVQVDATVAALGRGRSGERQD
jgi:hypothetical protein